MTVFARTGDDAQERWLRELQGVVHRVVRYHNMHQKIVVVDERVTLIGSLNVLSHTGRRGGTHDIMVVHEGQGFAKSVLKHEHAKLFANPPRTTKCGHNEVAEVWRSTSKREGHVWCWRCPACNDKQEIVFA